jgi:uncharacterized membrane protein
MSARPQRRPYIVRVAWAHKRLIGSVLLGIAAAFASPGSWITRALIGWDIGVLIYLAAAAVMMGRCAGVASMKRNAAEQDEGALAILVLTAGAALASLGAIFAELATIQTGDPGYPLYIALAIATVVLSWAFTHTIFALHYAHDFYGTGVRKDGLRFPGDDRPDYWDFVYFAFVIGMTFQVSDVAVTNKWIRRLVVAHGALSFFFTTAIMAMTINIAAGVIRT